MIIILGPMLTATASAYSNASLPLATSLSPPQGPVRACDATACQSHYLLTYQQLCGPYLWPQETQIQNPISPVCFVGPLLVTAIGLGSSWNQCPKQGLAFRMFILGSMKVGRGKCQSKCALWSPVWAPGLDPFRSPRGAVWNVPQVYFPKGQTRGEFVFCLSSPVGQGLLSGVNSLSLPDTCGIRRAGLQHLTWPDSGREAWGQKVGSVIEAADIMCGQLTSEHGWLCQEWLE